MFSVIDLRLVIRVHSIDHIKSLLLKRARLLRLELVIPLYVLVLPLNRHHPLLHVIRYRVQILLLVRFLDLVDSLEVLS